MEGQIQQASQRHRQENHHDLCKLNARDRNALEIAKVIMESANGHEVGTALMQFLQAASFVLPAGALAGRPLQDRHVLKSIREETSRADFE
ncbi:hypothetical protein NKH71_28820 [Mesorhizobium sp. M0983]|uniref:hypothetical protein n=1 Tax=Mesorhizobium sp. M0983 TaxID=2957040 RepID=UPI00333C892E